MKEVFKGARRSVDYRMPKDRDKRAYHEVESGKQLSRARDESWVVGVDHAVLAPFLAVDFPRRTELVYECAVALRPKRFLQRHFY